MNTQISLKWVSEAKTRLRDYPDETAFLYREPSGAIRVCKLIGNLPTDENWKAQDLASLRPVKLKEDAEFIVLPNLDISVGFERVKRSRSR